MRLQKQGKAYSHYIALKSLNEDGKSEFYVTVKKSTGGGLNAYELENDRKIDFEIKGHTLVLKVGRVMYYDQSLTLVPFEGEFSAIVVVSPRAIEEV